MSLDTADAGCRIALDDLREAVRVEVERARGAVKLIEAVDGLADRLTELAAAEADCDEHFARFPDDRKPWDEQSEGARADWMRCCERRHRAEEAMLKLAQLYVSLANEAA